MNERIRQLALQADLYAFVSDAGVDPDIEKFAELLLANLAEELSDVAQRSKQTNPEWAHGVDHAAMLAQRMTMNLPQWPEEE
jgi:hypothetical protein